MIKGRGLGSIRLWVRTCGFDCGYHYFKGIHFLEVDICRLKMRFQFVGKLCLGERKKNCGSGDGV